MAKKLQQPDAVRALGSALERAFETRLRQLAPTLPPGEREYRFDPARGWRFDFAWPAARLAVEIDGGTQLIGGGRHNGDADRWKLASAAAAGWRVLRFSGAMLDRDPARCIDLVVVALAGRGGNTDPDRYLACDQKVVNELT